MYKALIAPGLFMTHVWDIAEEDMVPEGKNKKKNRKDNSIKGKGKEKKLFWTVSQVTSYKKEL